MNGIQLAILICALAVSALILRHDLPLEFPLMMVKALLLFVKLFTVLALAVLAYLYAGGKKRPSGTKGGDCPHDG